MFLVPLGFSFPFLPCLLCALMANRPPRVSPKVLVRDVPFRRLISTLRADVTKATGFPDKATALAAFLTFPRRAEATQVNAHLEGQMHTDRELLSRVPCVPLSRPRPAIPVKETSKSPLPIVRNGPGEVLPSGHVWGRLTDPTPPHPRTDPSRVRSTRTAAWQGFTDIPSWDFLAQGRPVNPLPSELPGHLHSPLSAASSRNSHKLWVCFCFCFCFCFCTESLTGHESPRKACTCASQTPVDARRWQEPAGWFWNAAPCTYVSPANCPWLQVGEACPPATDGDLGAQCVWLFREASLRRSGPWFLLLLARRLPGLCARGSTFDVDGGMMRCQPRAGEGRESWGQRGAWKQRGRGTSLWCFHTPSEL